MSPDATELFWSMTFLLGCIFCIGNRLFYFQKNNYNKHNAELQPVNVSNILYVCIISHGIIFLDIP